MIWNLAIRRRVLTTVVFAVIAIFGLLGYRRMPVRENPDVEFPIVSVNVVLPGAEPRVIETEVLEPLEEQINTIEGLKTLKSTARQQVGVISAEFELYRDIDTAAQDVRARVRRARRDLPGDVEPPVVRKVDPDAQPILWIALTGDRRWDAVRLSNYADEEIRPRLENLRGAGRVIIGGQRRYAVRIRLDPVKLAAQRLRVQDVVRVIRANNADIPAGRIESDLREWLVRVEGQFSSAEPFNDLVLKYLGDRTVRLRDVGRAVAGVEDDRQTARFSGQLAVGLGVVKQSNANTVALAGRVRRRMAEVAERFPPGLRYRIATDDSQFVEASINDLSVTIFLTAGLVMLIVLSSTSRRSRPCSTSASCPATCGRAGPPDANATANTTARRSTPGRWRISRPWCPTKSSTNFSTPSSSSARATPPTSTFKRPCLR